MGDAYTYTLQPTYQNIGQEFQCYLRLSQQRILYDLYYYIEIPSVGFESQKIYRTVEVKDIKQRTKGHFKADFLTVEHNTGLDLENEFLLVGRKVKGEEHRNFTLHTFPPLAEYATSSPYFHLISGARRSNSPGRPGTTVTGEKLHVHTVSPNIFVANLQFERPFDFSTSTWSLEAASSRGILDKIRPVKPRFGQLREQPVTVRLQYTDGRYAYYPKSLDNPPYLRFSVPGNSSILPVFFKTGTGKLVTDDGTFKATLELVNHNRVWEVFVAGSMTDCPAYLGVTLNCHQEAEELVNFDLLISCPKEFNVTFKLPNWSPQLEKNFELILKDSVENHVFHLTHFTLETDEREGSRLDIDLKRPPSMLHHYNQHNHGRPIQANKVQTLTSSYSLLTVTMAVLCGCFLAFLATFIFAYFFKDALSVARGSKNRSQSSEAAVAFVDAHSDTCVDDERLFSTSARLCGCFCCRCGNFGGLYGRSNLSKSSRVKRRCMLFCFVVFCVSYSTFFTFTSSYLILSALNSVEWTELKAKLIVLKLEIENITGTEIRPELDFPAFTDGTVQMGRMMSACSAYADQLFLEAAKNSSKISRSKQEKIFSVSVLRSPKERTAKTNNGYEAGHHNPDNLPLNKRIMSIHSAIERELRIHGADRFSNLSKRLDDLVKDSVESFAPGVKRALFSYARFLGDVASSRWFSFPLQVFQQQQQHLSASKSIPGVRGFSYHSSDSELESPQNQLFDNFSVSSSYNILDEKLFKESCLEILKSVDFEFGKFLEIEEVDFVKIWLQRFWHKFEANLPKLPDFDKELFLNPTLVGESDRPECPLQCSDTRDCGRGGIDFSSYPDIIRYHTISEPRTGRQIYGTDPSERGFLKKRFLHVDVNKNWSEIGENGRHFPSKNLSDFKKMAKIKRKIVSDRKPNGRMRKSVSSSEEKNNSFIQPAPLSPTPKPLPMDTLPPPVYPALGQNSSAGSSNNTCDVVKIQRAAPQFERLSDAAEVDADVVDYRSDFHAFCGWTTYVFVSLDVILVTYRLAILLCKLHSYHRIFFGEKTNCQLESKEGREYYQVEVPLNTPEMLMYSTLPGPQSFHHRATNSAGSTPERLPLDHLRTRSKSVDQFYQQCCQQVLRSSTDQPFHEFSSTSIKTSGSSSSNPALRTAVGSQTFEQAAVKCDSYRQTPLQLSIEPHIAWCSCPFFLCCFLAAPFERPSRPRGQQGPPQGVKFSSVLMEILTGGTASKIFLAAGLAAMIFVTTTSLLDRLLDPTLADELSIGSLAATSQAEQLEAYSEEEAKYLNNHLAEVYRRQMAEELVMIANFVEFFNEDQRQMVKSFKRELCLIKRVMLAPLKVNCPGVDDDDDDDDDGDDDDKEDDLEELLRLLVLPCNFLPVKREKLESEKFINSQRLLFSNVLSPLTAIITSIIIKTSLFFIISIFIYISVAVLTCHCTLSFAYKQLHSPGVCHPYTCTHLRHQRQLLTSQSPNFRDGCEVGRSTSSPYFGGCKEMARSSTLPSKCVHAGSPTAHKTTQDTYQQQQQQQQKQQQQQQYQKQQQQQQECPHHSNSPPFHHHHHRHHHHHHPLPHHHHHHHQQQHCHQEEQIQDHPKYSETKV